MDTGMETEPKSIFLVTAAKHQPDLVDLMKLSSKAEFGNLKSNDSTTKKKFKCLYVLTPTLAQAIQKTDMTYAAIIITIVQHVKLSIPTPAATATLHSK